MADRYVTKQCDLAFDLICQRMFASAYQNVRLDSHSLKFLDTCLGRFGLHFLRSFEVWDQGYMNEDCIVMSHIMLELTDGSRNGWLSMSPTVPPTSMIAILSSSGDLAR